MLHPHPWPETIEEAIAIQEQLRSLVITENQLSTVRYVAGVDVGYDSANSVSLAAVTVLSFPDLQLQQQSVIRSATAFPYVPGFLSFREVPAVLEALENISLKPDLILCDGQGLAHPRRFGLACHLGVLTGIATIGVAKTRFVGEHSEVGIERGSWQPLLEEGSIVGAALRTQTGVKPMYVSIGHRINLISAIEYVLRCTPRYRLPETTRSADRLTAG
ncbi:deoxyribonuclease V [Microcoleus sp. LEGE 07076]|uniref:deoxyribonuclease V n=1 Tax=Microcoleus sp. LEGE 07076 TaxID=915322 RepID=UPI00187DE03C|nr:deoxyribonuclease V [Microcoleus sp. LEGE 07076]MBE9186497.1 deoxyribonuclease V [Microcoleus sp. LEGE 07076]